MSLFVGRERELGLLAECVRMALAGTAQVVLVSGEPGVGKTRLAERIGELARSEGMGYAAGRGTDDEGSPPFWPVRRVLAAVAAPEVLAEDSVGDERADVAARERFRRYEMVTEAIRQAAEPHGLFLLLDDVQWADGGTLALLVHLARYLSFARVVLVATYRSTETMGKAALERALSQLASEPAVVRVPLTGLSEEHTHAYLDSQTGFAVPPPVAAGVYRRTGGNPFFVAELGRLLTEARATDEQPLPEGVRDAVRARLGLLTPGCHSVVAAAAVLGTTFEPAALAAGTGLSVAEVLAAVDEAAAAGIASGGRFSHDLVRETAAGDVATAERLALHARLAGYLQGRPDAGSRPAEVAYHWVQSLPVGDAVEAVGWSRRAGDRAMAQLAWEEAALWYGRALDTASGPVC